MGGGRGVENTQKSHKIQGEPLDKKSVWGVGVWGVDGGYTSHQGESSQVIFIYIALLTIQIVTKQLHNIKMGK